jgi:uncharacterized protein YcbK (DUF882 family)
MLLTILEPIRAIALTVATWVTEAPPSPVTFRVYDVNHEDYATITINTDGTMTKPNAKAMRHLMRCRRSGREPKTIDPFLLTMIADIAKRWPGKTIDFMSGYRKFKGEKRTSLHRAARAFDFSVRGVKLRELRDYAWSNFRQVGVGWYPDLGFIHLDHRKPGMKDTAWTYKRAKEHYNPYWANKIRPTIAPPQKRFRKGLAKSPAVDEHEIVAIGDLF